MTETAGFVYRQKIAWFGRPKCEALRLDGSPVAYFVKRLASSQRAAVLYKDAKHLTPLLQILIRKTEEGRLADVLDSRGELRLGTLKPIDVKNLKQEHWRLVDAADQFLAEIRERTAMERRSALRSMVPRDFDILDADGASFGNVCMHAAILREEMTMEFDASCNIDHDILLGVGAWMFLLRTSNR